MYLTAGTLARRPSCGYVDGLQRRLRSRIGTIFIPIFANGLGLVFEDGTSCCWKHTRGQSANDDFVESDNQDKHSLRTSDHICDKADLGDKTFFLHLTSL